MGLFGPKEADFGSKRANFGPERGDFRSKRVDLGLIGLISGLKEPDLDLSGLREGGCTDGRTYVRTDVRKFTPVSYRTSAVWGRCPERRKERDHDETSTMELFVRES